MAYIIGMDPDLSVMGFAENGAEALQLIKHQRPDIILTDLEMPVMNGFELTKKIMETDPTPIIVISGAYNPAEIARAFETIDAGALTIIEKPKGIGDAQSIDTARFITETIKKISTIKLSKKPVEESSKGPAKRLPSQETSWHGSSIDAMGIGASVGGPKAIRYILTELPDNFPAPIFIVQHITAGFVDGFIHWLKNATTFEVKIAENGEAPKSKTVYICPDNMLMHLDSKETISVIPIATLAQSTECISELFYSMAKHYGANSIGMLLTGMGSDGSEGLLQMKKAGAFTIVQDESTSVNYDMPKNAIEAGAATKILPLDEMPNILEKLSKECSK